eukprot:6373605-Amphidinium_carterae.1
MVVGDAVNDCLQRLREFGIDAHILAYAEKSMPLLIDPQHAANQDVVCTSAIEVPVVLKQQLQQVRAAVDTSAADMCMSPEQAEELKNIINQLSTFLDTAKNVCPQSGLNARVSTQLAFLLLHTVAVSDATQGISANKADTLDNMLQEAATALLNLPVMSQQQVQCMFHPLRFGGLGPTSAVNMREAALCRYADKSMETFLFWDGCWGVAHGPHASFTSDGDPKLTCSDVE